MAAKAMGVRLVVGVGFLVAATVITIGLARGWSVGVVETGSMAPAVAPGSLIVLAPPDPASLDVGAVVTFEDASGQVIGHRIESVTEARSGRVFVTRGDANASADPVPVSEGQVRARVALAIPGVGRVAAGVANPAVGLAVFAVGLIGFGFDLERRHRRPVREGAF